MVNGKRSKSMNKLTLPNGDVKLAREGWELKSLEGWDGITFKECIGI